MQLINKTTNAVKNPTTIVNHVRRLPHLNPWLAVAVAFTFGAIGAYTLLGSRASNATLYVEAETLTLPAGSSIVTDTQARDGKAVLMTTNGQATGTVNFLAPVSSVTVRARAAVCRGGAQAQLLIDGAVVTTVTASGKWADFTAAANLKAGTHSIALKYVNDYVYNHPKKGCDRNLYLDSAGFIESAPVDTNQAPQVTVAAPTNGAVLTSATTVTANASDSSGVAGVQFKLDGANLGAEDTAAPYQVPWDATKASPGSHTISATARDTTGLASTATITVTVQTASTPTSPTGLAAGVSTGGGIWFYGSTDVESEMQMVKDLGATWVRVDMYWSKVETANNSYNWTQADRIWNAAKNRGIKVLWVYHRTPAWARGNAGTDLRYPTNSSEYGDFAAVAAQRYQGSAWEFWNEPNGTWAAEDVTLTGQKKLAQMTMDAVAKIDAVDSSAILIGPGVLRGGSTGSTSYSLDTEYLKGLYAGGLQGSKLDALGYHAYSFPWSPKDTRTDVNQGWNQLARYVDVARAHGDTSKVWLTEQGQQTGGEGGVSESVQAQYITEAFERYRQEVAAGRVTGPLFWYQQRDGGTQPYSTREHAFGLARYDRSHKPGWEVFVGQAALLK